MNKADQVVGHVGGAIGTVVNAALMASAIARQQRDFDASRKREQDSRLRTAAAGGRERVLRSTIEELREQLADAREEVAENEADRGQLLRLLVELRRENGLLRELAVEGV